MEVVVTTGSLECKVVQSSSQIITTNKPTPSFCRMPFLSPNQQCQSTEGNISHSMDLLTPSSPGGLPTFWPLIAPGYVGGGLPCFSSALWCQYHHFPFMGLKVRKHVHLPVCLLFCFKSFYRSEKGPEPEKKYFSEYGAAKGPVLPNRMHTPIQAPWVVKKTGHTSRDHYIQA